VDSESITQATIEAVARNSYGQLIAYLASRSGDVAGAEDALSEAFIAALKQWPLGGIPKKPEAWLLHAARNRLIDVARHNEVRMSSEPELQRIAEAAESVALSEDHFPDERLKLLFVCAHPSIDPASRTPLMLQIVLGLDAARIAGAFLISPAAMGQRLVRAKLKIRDAAIPFRVPEPPEWGERLTFVLDAIYAGYSTGWDDLLETNPSHRALTTDALALGRLLVNLMPDEPEAHGLLALMLHCEARKDARIGDADEFIPLDQQDTTKWSRPLISEAEEHLQVASGHKSLGPYQLEAAIQSVHAGRATTGRIEWQEIALLYEELVRIAPRIGLLVGRAVALAQAGDPVGGFAALNTIPVERVAEYQPYWAARGHLLRQLKRYLEAKESWERAADLTDEPSLGRYLAHCAMNTPAL
jgi:RNA polymerase sigma factor (sigma-70 family)